MKIIEYILEKKIFYLIIGFIFSIISIGRFNFTLSIFIWPYCFLAYLHQNEKKVIPLIIVSACLLVSNIIRWIGIDNTSVLTSLVVGIYFSIINIIPYIIDDILYNKITKWASVFIFPLLVPFIEYVFAFVPIANQNIYAYGIRNNIQIIQICSLFGCYFLSFIIALFASIVDYSYNLFTKEKIISKFIYIYTIIILIIICFGSIRLLIPQKEERFNIAAVLGSSPCLYEEGKESKLPIDTYMDYIQKTIIKANNSEAKVILYSEEGFSIKGNERNDIISKTAKLAEKYNIFVVLTLDIEYEKDDCKNEAILISNKGYVLYYYQKKNLIPIMESEYHSNNSEYKTFYTEFGQLGVVICYDIDFPYYLNQLSRLGLDTLLIPSWDWDGITEPHSTELKFRAIENGFNTMKSTANGITLSNDYKGRFLAYYQPSKCEDYFVLSSVYKKGTKTLYSYIGIFFNYLYLVAFIILAIIGRYKMIKESNELEIGKLILQEE